MLDTGSPPTKAENNNGGRLALRTNTPVIWQQGYVAAHVRVKPSRTIVSVWCLYLTPGCLRE